MNPNRRQFIKMLAATGGVVGLAGAAGLGRNHVARFGRDKISRRQILRSPFAGLDQRQFPARARGKNELHTPTNEVAMPTKIALAPEQLPSCERFSKRSNEITYIRLNTQTPCPPRGAVPVNARKDRAIWVPAIMRGRSES